MMLIYKYNGFGKLTLEKPRAFIYGAANLPTTIKKDNRLEKRRGEITPRLTHTPSLPKTPMGITVIGLFFYAPKTYGQMITK